MKKATVSAHNSITQCETEIIKVFQYGPENSNNNNNKPYMSAWQVRIEWLLHFGATALICDKQQGALPHHSCFYTIKGVKKAK